MLLNWYLDSHIRGESLFLLSFEKVSWLSSECSTLLCIYSVALVLSERRCKNNKVFLCATNFNSSVFRCDNDVCGLTGSLERWQISVPVFSLPKKTVDRSSSRFPLLWLLMTHNSQNYSLGRRNTRQQWKHSLIPQVGGSVYKGTMWRNINSLNWVQAPFTRPLRAAFGYSQVAQMTGASLDTPYVWATTCVLLSYTHFFFFFTRSVKSASGVFIPPHLLTTSTGCLGKTLQRWNLCFLPSQKTTPLPCPLLCRTELELQHSVPRKRHFQLKVNSLVCTKIEPSELFTVLPEYPLGLNPICSAHELSNKNQHSLQLPIKKTCPFFFTWCYL